MNILIRSCFQSAKRDCESKTIEILVCFSVGLAISTPICLALFLSELRNLDLHSLVQSLLQIWPVSKHEEDLHPNKERSQEQGLHQVVEQSRRSAFKLAMSNKLCDPAHDEYATCPFIRSCTVNIEEVVAIDGPRHYEWEDQAAGNWLHKEVES